MEPFIEEEESETDDDARSTNSSHSVSSYTSSRSVSTMGTEIGRGREMSWGNSQMENFQRNLPNFSTSFSEKQERQMEKRVHSPSSPATRLAKQNLEILRTSLIERAWQSGVQGRKRLEAGFTLDVCRKIAHIKKVNGEDDYDAAYSLVLWVVQEWPCDPPLSTVPVNPSKLGQDCAEMLYNYRPGIDETHPENSAYLLPLWLRPMVEELDIIEKRGAKCSHRLEKGGRMQEMEEGEKAKLRREGDVHGRNIWEGINEEIERQDDDYREERRTIAFKEDFEFDLDEELGEEREEGVENGGEFNDDGGGGGGGGGGEIDEEEEDDDFF
ncbi:hypothetical protein TrLO_g9332 [Triparma laevis f. longispina]|uniref:Uncharacterized protein n=1 Tax=Triparma laevis f. longispina TaxID=1714387 RepID=A0A9W6ZNN0_9STRA|nr:hypothetical protein TrLO_g9332 [Triparma laevis f. longispina]